jgi:hypothetical protein
METNEEKSKKLRLICTVGWGITVAAMVVLACVLFPSRVSTLGFWLKVLWAGFLAAVTWISIFVFISTPLRADEPRKGFGRITPAIAVMGIGYALVSMTLLLIQICFADSEIVVRIFWAAQIILFALVAVIGVLTGVAMTHAEPKARSARPPTITPITKKEE